MSSSATPGRILTALTALLGCGAGTEPPPPGNADVHLALVASGFSFPVYVTAAPGDHTRLFVVEKTGRIRIVREGSVLGQSFLDLHLLVSGGSEQGLLGLAFDPEYAANGRFYVDYTNTAGNTVVARYLRSADPDVAQPTADRVLLTVGQPYSNHNGGMIAFGPDGYLYVALGDGGSANDPQGHGQDRTELLGSLLRLDVRGAGDYAIPPDNPYAGSATFRSELWNYGLRNPWRFSFDRQSGELWIGDVGQGAWEEIDFVPASSAGGENFGWNIMEGAHCFLRAGCSPTGLVPPLTEYGHDEGCAVTGGYVYRGSAAPALEGLYLFGDYCGGWVHSIRRQGGRATELTDWPGLRPAGGITSFGEDAAGELYLTTDAGRVYRVVEGGTP